MSFTNVSKTQLVNNNLGQMQLSSKHGELLQSAFKRNYSPSKSPSLLDLKSNYESKSAYESNKQRFVSPYKTSKTVTESVYGKSGSQLHEECEKTIEYLNQEFRHQNNKFTQAINSKDILIEQLKQRINELESQLQLRPQIQSQLQIQIHQKETEIIDLREKGNKQEQQIGELKSQIIILKDLEDKIFFLKQENDRLSFAKGSRESELIKNRDLETRNQQLQMELERMSQSMKLKMKEGEDIKLFNLNIEQDLQRQIQKLEHEKRLILQDCSNLNEEITKKQDINNRLDRQINELQHQNYNINQNYNQKQIENENLNNNLNQLQDENHNLQLLIRQHTSTINGLNSVMEQNEQLLLNTKSMELTIQSLQNVQDENKQIQKQKQSLQIQIDALNDKRLRKKQKIQNFKNTLTHYESIEEKMIILSQEIDRLNGIIQMRDQDFNELTDNLSERNLETQRLKQLIENLKIEKNQIIFEFENRAQRQQNEIIEHFQTQERLKGIIDDKMHQIQSIQQNNSTLDHQLQAINHESKHFKSELHNSEMTNRQQIIEFQNLQGEKNRLLNECSNYQMIQQQLRNELDLLNQKYLNSEDNRNNQILKSNQHIYELETRIKLLNSEIEHLNIVIKNQSITNLQNTIVRASSPQRIVLSDNTSLRHSSQYLSIPQQTVIQPVVQQIVRTSSPQTIVLKDNISQRNSSQYQSIPQQTAIQLGVKQKIQSQQEQTYSVPTSFVKPNGRKNSYVSPAVSNLVQQNYYKS